MYARVTHAQIAPEKLERLATNSMRCFSTNKCLLETLPSRNLAVYCYQVLFKHS